MTDLVDVEAVVARLPGVARVVVLGEVPTAYIVRSGDRDLPVSDLPR